MKKWWILWILFSAVLSSSLLILSKRTFTNPLMTSGPNPWVTYYDGYYMAATTWGIPSVGLTMRKAPTINKLKEAEDQQIWQDSILERSSNFWVPEFFLLDSLPCQRPD